MNAATPVGCRGCWRKAEMMSRPPTNTDPDKTKLGTMCPRRRHLRGFPATPPARTGNDVPALTTDPPRGTLPRNDKDSRGRITSHGPDHRGLRRHGDGQRQADPDPLPRLRPHRRRLLLRRLRLRHHRVADPGHDAQRFRHRRADRHGGERDGAWPVRRAYRAGRVH
jgi:hypothetical protein